MPRKYAVTQNPEKKIPVQILAESIREISEGMKQIKRGDLNERAIILLIQDVTKVAQRDIKQVLDALASLDKYYLKPKTGAIQ